MIPSNPIQSTRASGELDMSAVGSDSHMAVGGAWLMQLAKILMDRADNKLQAVLDDSKNQNAVASAMITVGKVMAQNPDGFDNRINGPSGDTNCEADNQKNIDGANAYNHAIDEAINSLPSDSPYRQELASLKIPQERIDHKDGNGNHDFILGKSEMAGMQAQFEGLKKQNDADGNMKTFYAQQAVSDRSELIQMLSGIQQSINKTLEFQSQKIG
jgi:hypothetical protein